MSQQKTPGDADWLAPVAFLFNDTNKKASPSPESSAVKPDPRVREIAMGALVRRGLSRREFEQFLLDSGVALEQIEQLSKEFEAEGLLDDLTLAKNIAASLMDRRGLSRNRIRAELFRRLFTDQVIGAVIELVDDEGEMARALALAKAYAPRLAAHPRQTVLRRLGAYLSRRGYPEEIIRAAVNHALPER